MSEVSTNTNAVAEVFYTVLDTMNNGWGYTFGGLILVAAGGYFAIKKLNTPSFMVKQIRRRNLKEMKKQGVVGNSESMVDLDRLLDSVEAYASKQGMTGSEMSRLLQPLQDSNAGKSGSGFYHTISHIAKNVGDMALATEMQKKSKQVKSNSALMAGLLKRAGV